MTVRLRVKEIAQSKGISQGKLSRLSDVSLNTIRRIWHDEGHVTNTDILERLARALGVRVADLFEEIPDEKTI
jgi:DNA-binding Xre family transcriptional regulator